MANAVTEFNDKVLYVISVSDNAQNAHTSGISDGISTVVGGASAVLGLATAGGITSGGAIVVESLLKKQGMENVQNDLNQDYFRAFNGFF